MSSLIPEHENSRFWPFRDKFVIVETVSNIKVGWFQVRNFFTIYYLYTTSNNARTPRSLYSFFGQPTLAKFY